MRLRSPNPSTESRSNQITSHHLGVAVVALGEVPVVRGDDGVLLPLLLRTVPLPDARTARVGEHRCAGLLERGRETVAGDRGAYLSRHVGQRPGGLWVTETKDLETARRDLQRACLPADQNAGVFLFLADE